MPSRNEDRQAVNSFNKYIDPSMLANPDPDSHSFPPIFPRSLTANQKIQMTISRYVMKSRFIVQEMCNEMYQMLVAQMVAGEFTLSDMQGLRGSQGNAQTVFTSELLKEVKKLRSYDPLDAYLPGPNIYQSYS